jgi:hypothetical protein
MRIKLPDHVNISHLVKERQIRVVTVLMQYRYGVLPAISGAKQNTVLGFLDGECR